MHTSTRRASISVHHKRIEISRSTCANRTTQLRRLSQRRRRRRCPMRDGEDERRTTVAFICVVNCSAGVFGVSHGRQCLNCQKISGGLTISRHAIDLNRYVRKYVGGLKLTPPPRVSQGILFGGVSKQLGGSTPRQFKH
jgi:hypothetical protein